MERKLRILVAGATGPRHEEIAAMLREHPAAGAVVAGAADAAALPMAVARNDPDLVVLVVPKAGVETLEVVERLTHAYPTMTPVLVCDNTSPDFVMRAMRAGVREMLPTAVEGHALAEVVRRVHQKRVAHADRQGQVLAFMSCKGGGGGATVLASNVAYALAAEEGKRVVLIDLNLQWGDAVFLVSDKHPPVTLADLAQQLHRVDQAFLAASLVRPHPNFGVLAAPEDPVHALDIKPEHIDVIVRLARAQFDYVILDTGRALDAVTVRGLDYSDAIFLVLQLSLPFIRDGKRLLSAFRTLDYRAEKVKLLVNRFEKGRDIGLKELEETLGSKVFRTFPNDYERVAKSINQGVAVVKMAPGSPFARAVKEFAHGLVEVAASSSGGWFSRMLGRR